MWSALQKKVTKYRKIWEKNINFYEIYIQLNKKLNSYITTYVKTSISPYPTLYILNTL